MNKADLIDMVAGETGSTKVDAAKALDAVVDAVTGALGTFSVRHRKEREGINPQNPSQKIHIPAANVPVFKAGKALKASVN
jgi:DNA-binding protein HU-beta